MAANSWMQHPVGYTTNNSTHQPQLDNIWALFTNPVFLWGYTHVVLASLVTGAAIMLAVSAWHLHKQHQVEAFRRTAVISLVVLLPTVAAEPLRRQRARGRGGHVSADEDRSCRSALDDL